MRRGRDSDSKKLGKVLRFVSPPPRVIAGTIFVQIVLFISAVGWVAVLLLPPGLTGALRGPGPLARGPEWAAPLALLLFGELLRRWANRRLMSVHEGGVSYVEGRALRRIAWDDIERAETKESGCRLRLRGGEEVVLPGPLAESAEVREALARATSGRAAP